MSAHTNDAVDILRILGIALTPISIVLAIAIILIIKYPEKISYIRAGIAKTCSFMGTRFRKAHVAEKMRGNILRATSVISSENKHIAPYGLSIQWIDDKNPEAFIKDNQIIVRMSDKHNADQNNVWAVNAYVREGIVPLAKPYMPDRLRQATDLLMTKKILEIFSKGSLPSFFNGPFALYLKDSQLAVLVDDLQKVDNNGLFTRVFLNELAKLSNMPDLELPSERIKTEIRDFASFLINIATREREKWVNLQFWTQRIKVAFILAASEDSREVIEINTEKVARYINSKYNTIYILALERKIVVAKDLLKSIEQRFSFISAGRQQYYKHKTREGYVLNGICIELDLFDDLTPIH